MQTETTTGMTPRTATDVANREKPVAFGDCPGCGERDRDGYDVETGVGLCEECATSDDVDLRADGNGDGPTFHVVCHDCDFEEVVTGAPVAARKKIYHEETNAGHQASYSRVDGGA